MEQLSFAYLPQELQSGMTVVQLQRDVRWGPARGVESVQTEKKASGPLGNAQVPQTSPF